MAILHELSNIVGAAFETVGLDRTLGAVVTSDRIDLAQFQCNGALAGAKKAGRPPREIAEEAAAIIEADEHIRSVQVAGPGFLNIHVEDSWLASLLADTAADENLGINSVSEPRTVVIDYGGPNVAKDLHVGHVRTALIGESIKRMYRSVGHKAIGDIHLGDWGLPMGQLIASLEESHSDLAFFDPEATEFPAESPVTEADLLKLYPEASQRFKDDEDFQVKARAATVALQNGHPGYTALWQHFRTVSLEAFAKTYSRLGVNFELWNGEASVAERTNELIEELREKGVAVESDGALVIPVETEEDTAEMPPLMLLNARGGLTYGATDVATIDERVQDLEATDIVYVVDLRQSLHFTQVFRAARIGGIVPETVELTHAGNGTVNGPDGKPFKTRDGSLPRLRELLDDVSVLAMKQLDENELATDMAADERAEVAQLVGLAALKFGELSNHRTTNYSFDLERFTQLQGKTGPYLLYVTVRTKSILERLAAEGSTPTDFIAPTVDAERQLALALLNWPYIVERSLAGHTPNTIAEYAYDLSGTFNRFYDACHILSEENPAQQGSWLSLVALTRSVLVAALEMLLIEVPERM